MDKISIFTMCTFTPPSFAALDTSSATSCSKSFTCALQVTPKGKRLGQNACIGRVAQGRHGGGMLLLGVFEKVGGKVCWACLKKQTVTLGGGQTRMGRGL